MYVHPTIHSTTQSHTIFAPRSYNTHNVHAPVSTTTLATLSPTSWAQLASPHIKQNRLARGHITGTLNTISYSYEFSHPTNLLPSVIFILFLPSAPQTPNINLCSTHPTHILAYTDIYWPTP
ncbi:hypothetical protein GDO81_016542 [Engystomops pustulosus]|uniref:Uncharacterized protein n=1 Tax=Engystomops pustulosus TaxID=76066 RepID=A0AAV7ASW0_ENGPU|nr:hypothetical protein GDO81_016542 [Engystomops pustulosus]